MQNMEKHFLGWLMVCIVLINNACITRNRRCDVTFFLTIAETMPAGNLQYFILTYAIKSFSSFFQQ